jgi:hypothetical protein
MNNFVNELQLKIERLENEINFKNGLISILSHDSKELFGNFFAYRIAGAKDHK